MRTTGGDFFATVSGGEVGASTGRSGLEEGLAAGRRGGGGGVSPAFAVRNAAAGNGRWEDEQRGQSVDLAGRAKLFHCCRVSAWALQHVVLQRGYLLSVTT